MKAAFHPIDFTNNNLFRVERFDAATPCEHNGLHLHHGYEIVYVKNGNGTIKVANKELTYSNGTLIFIGPSIPHFSFSNTTYDDNFEVVIHLNEDFVTNRLALFYEFSQVLKLIESSKRVLVFDQLTKKSQATLFDNIVNYDADEQLVGILGLLLNLSKVKTGQRLLTTNLGEKYGQNRQIKKVFDFVNDNFHRPISTKNIAKEVGLTTNSFCRMFKKTTGKSFISYLKDYRIYRAAKLLEESDEPISKIMHECGFDNPSYFAKVFAQVKGMSPGVYRNKYNE